MMGAKGRLKPGNWLTYSGNYAGHRYSPLAQINDQNVARLGSFAGAHDSPVLEFIHDPRGAAVAQAQPALEQGNAGFLFAADDLDALLDDFLVLVAGALFGPGERTSDLAAVPDAATQEAAPADPGLSALEGGRLA